MTQEKKPLDRVEVAFVYNGQQVETRICFRNDAKRLGQQMVRQYAGMFSGSYRIRELPELPRKTKPVTKPKVNVTHYFTIVA